VIVDLVVSILRNTNHFTACCRKEVDLLGQLRVVVIEVPSINEQLRWRSFQGEIRRCRGFTTRPELLLLDFVFGAVNDHARDIGIWRVGMAGWKDSQLKNRFVATANYCNHLGIIQTFGMYTATRAPEAWVGSDRSALYTLSVFQS
jgi:hypothetical protein